MTDEQFEKINFKNTTGSEGTIGKLFFDKWLLDNGFIAKGIRNIYHPDGIFFNPQTKESISSNFGLKLNSGTIFYLTFGGIYFKMPDTEQDIENFKNGELEPITGK